MKKKLVALMMVGVFAIALVGCGENKKPEEVASAAAAKAESAVENVESAVDNAESAVEDTVENVSEITDAEVDSGDTVTEESAESESSSLA